MNAGATTAVVTLDLAAPPETVYDEWLNVDSLMEWMCPHPARPLTIEIDPVVGGRMRFDIDEDGSRLLVTGTYLTLDRPRRIEFTWNCSTWPVGEQDSVVAVTFEGIGNGETRMTIEHSRLPEGTSDNHERGWTLIAEQLMMQLV